VYQVIYNRFAYRVSGCVYSTLELVRDENIQEIISTEDTEIRRVLDDIMISSRL
jgi:hypothetical protein